MMRRGWIYAGAVFGGVLALDQLTKVWVERAFTLGESLPLLPFFSLTYVRNEGAAWGILQGRQILLAIVGAVAVLVLTRFWRAIFGDHPLALPALGLLNAGIVGNLIDRVRLSYVVDFVDLHWAGCHFPCFNIADCAISLAVGLIFYFEWRNSRTRHA